MLNDNILLNQIRRKRRGRPPNTTQVRLMAMLWFYAIADILKTVSPRLIEISILKRIHGDDYDKEKHIPTGKFYSKKRGEYLPLKPLKSDVKQAKIDVERYLDLPLWTVVKTKLNTIEELYRAMALLRPDIANYFYPLTPDNFSQSYQVMYQMDQLLLALNKESDLDALTACIGAVRVAQHYDETFTKDPIPINDFLHSFLHMYIRVFSQKPYCYIAQEMFDYLVTNFFNYPSVSLQYPEFYDFQDYLKINDYIDLDESDDFEIISGLEDLDISDLIADSQARLFIIKELGLLKHLGDPDPPLSCLYLAEHYLTSTFIQTYRTLLEFGDIQELKQLTQIQNLAHALALWENQRLDKSQPEEKHNNIVYVPVLPGQFKTEHWSA